MIDLQLPPQRKAKRPFGHALATLGAILMAPVAILASVFFGLIALLVVLGVGSGMLLWVWFSTRDLRRTLRENMDAGARAKPQGTGNANGRPGFNTSVNDTIEGEYTVIDDQ